ncbi:hypothetical protein TWF730_001689 [Orbilia blumenaviensis]|uniref:Uncharacterized protein n=1 Tax=Orbilia blumenaviensis TaxID=1796055 RepID=A0AAV9UJ87_9PEZI
MTFAPTQIAKVEVAHPYPLRESREAVRTKAEDVKRYIFGEPQDFNHSAVINRTWLSLRRAVAEIRGSFEEFYYSGAAQDPAKLTYEHLNPTQKLQIRAAISNHNLYRFQHTVISSTLHEQNMSTDDTDYWTPWLWDNHIVELRSKKSRTARKKKKKVEGNAEGGGELEGLEGSEGRKEVERQEEAEQVEGVRVRVQGRVRLPGISELILRPPADKRYYFD